MNVLKPIFRTILISDAIGNCIRFFTRSVVPFHQVKINVSSSEIRGKVVSLLFFKKYEKEEIGLIKKHMRSDLPIMDLGTSIGAVAVHAAKASDNKIVCVEANPNLPSTIARNFETNDVSSDRFTIENCAISDLQQGTRRCYFSSRGSNERGRICDANEEGAVVIPSIPLSKLVSKHIKKDYILISDIEGAEAAFLFHDEKSLENCRQLFIELHPVEWNGKKYSVPDMVDRIIELGFELEATKFSNFYFSKDEAS